MKPEIEREKISYVQNEIITRKIRNWKKKQQIERHNINKGMFSRLGELYYTK